MTKVGIYQAKCSLSALIKRVRAGEAFEITDRGKPVATLAPMAAAVRAAPEAPPSSLSLLDILKAAQ